MVVTSDIIRQTFFELLHENASREDVSKWAIENQSALDLGILEFHPMNEEEKIWDALEFLELYCEKLDTVSYLYSKQDLLEYMDKNRWNE